jgi:hypothetical protein
MRRTICAYPFCAGTLRTHPHKQIQIGARQSMGRALPGCELEALGGDLAGGTEGDLAANDLADFAGSEPEALVSG